MSIPRSALVTGGAGFIGAPLCTALARAGCDVLALDDLSAPGTQAPLPAPRLGFVRADVRDAAAVARAAAGRELVVHLASVVGVERVLVEPARTESVCLDGARAVLAACRAQRAALVLFSSSEVTDSPRRGPRAAYARAKRAAEELALAAAHELPVTIVRPFNVVGPGQSAEQGMVLPVLAAAARAGRPLPVHGDGRQQRCFLHVDDLVEALLALFAATGGRASPGGEILEIGGTERVAIGEVAERLAALGAPGARVQRGTPAPQREDQERRAPDLSALRRRITFLPRRDLSAILADVLSRA
jgi:UDP-glucose 4-epimerase